MTVATRVRRAPGSTAAIRALRSCAVLASLPAEAFTTFARSATRITVRSGEVLMRQGDAADAAYVISSGRLRATVHGEDGATRSVYRGAGEMIGELALIADLPRSATVTAVRDSELFKVSSSDFRRAVRAHPDVVLRMCNSLARRGAFRAAEDETSSAARTIAIVPAGSDGVGLRRFVAQLEKALRRSGRVARVDAVAAGLNNGARPSESALLTRLHRLEEDHRFVLYVGDALPSDWTTRCARQADLVLLVGRGGARPDPSLAESAVPGDVQRELVLLWDEGVKPHDTMAWLERRDVGTHHHVCGSSDYRRLARRIAAETVGVVLGGGGAAGLAHLGVLRALEENGTPIDVIGGTSSGAIIASLFAMGWDHEGRVARAIDGFVASRMLIAPTLPLVAFSSSRKVTGNMRRTMGDALVEDQRVPFFAVSANLSNGETVVHSTGPMWRAIRASASLPSIMPPVWNDGHLLVDGGVVSNLPVGIMRDRINGRVIAVDVRPRMYGKRYAQFDPTISG